MTCKAFAILNLVTIETQADGSQRTRRLSLLDGKNGIWLNDWSPSFLNYKGGGQIVNSPLADGITPVLAFWDDIIDVFTISASDKKQDQTIKRLRDLGDFLVKAVQYWTTDWQDEVVWLEARGAHETKTRYAEVKMWQVPGHSNPYRNPFFNISESALGNIQLTITHAPWASIPPGQPCPEDKTETETYYFPSYLEFDGASGDVNCGSNASIDDLPDNAVAGKGQITVEAWIRADGWGQGGFGFIVCKPGTLGWALYISTGQGLRGYINYPAQNATAISGTDEFSPDSLWHHVLLTYDETGAGTPAARTIYLAIDGVWVASYVSQQASIGNYNSDAAVDLYIGNNSAGNVTFDGEIGWARVSDSVRYDPAGGNFTPEARCDLPDIDANVVLQTVYEGSGATTYDRSGNDNDGTITDAEWGCDCTYTDEDDVECNCVQASGEQENWEYEDWQINTSQPNGNVYALLKLQSALYSGRILAADGNGDIWRTDDCGATNWTASTTDPTVPWALTEDLSTGYVYSAGQNGIYRSTDGGVNWANVNNVVRGQQVNCLKYNPGDGYLYLANSTTETIQRSTDGGVTWNDVFDPHGQAYCLYCDADGVILAACKSITTFIIVRSENGTDWEIVHNNIREAHFIGKVSDGNYYCPANTFVFYSTDGKSWSNLFSYSPVVETNGMIHRSIDDKIYYISNGLAAAYIYRSNEASGLIQEIYSFAAATYSIVECDNGTVLVGINGGDIYQSPSYATVGRSDTCTDEVFIANKKTVAQLTHIFVYDTSRAVYVNQFPAIIFPYPLLPQPSATGDIVYFGIDSTILDIGPFCSLVFDIYEPSIISSTFAWEYYDGAAWQTLNVNDETAVGFPFDKAGINGVYWVPPDDWSTVAVNGVTALWVRMRIVALASWIQSPLQQRDVYTVTWPRVDIDDSQVKGDIPALLRIEAHNRSDEDAYATIDELDLLDNRVLVGLRTLNRGSFFTSFINLAELGVVADTYPQNPVGITVTDGTGTTTVADNQAPSGIVCEHTTTGNGLTIYDDAAVITLGPSIARDYYGEFHAFLRAHLYEPAASPVGDLTDVRVRLKIQTGSGGIVEYTEYVAFTGFDADDGAGAEERYNDFLLLDMGRVKLPVAGTIRSTELPDEFTITIQIASDTSTNLRVKIYDLNLSPADECIADLQDVAFEDDSGISNGYRMDADSVYFLKPPGIRALVRTADSAEFIKANYQPIIAGQLFLQENADQRLFFLAARAAKQGEHTGLNNAATLTDSYADFIAAGVRPGMIIYNTTDGSSATITNLTGTTITGALAGGAGNDWDTGDVYLIVCPNWLSSPCIVHSIQLEAKQRYLDMRGGS